MTSALLKTALAAVTLSLISGCYATSNPICGFESATAFDALPKMGIEAVPYEIIDGEGGKTDVVVSRQSEGRYEIQAANGEMTPVVSCMSEGQAIVQMGTDSGAWQVFLLESSQSDSKQSALSLAVFKKSVSAADKQRLGIESSNDFLIVNSDEDLNRLAVTSFEALKSEGESKAMVLTLRKK